MFSPFSSTLIAGEWLGNAVGICLIAAFLVYLRLRSLGAYRFKSLTISCALLGTAVLICLLGSIHMALQGTPESAGSLSPAGLAGGLLSSLQPAVPVVVSSTVTFLGAVTILAKSHRWALGLALVWVIALPAPLTLSPGPIHRYYLPQASSCLMYAFAVSVGIERLLKFYRYSPMPRNPSGEVANVQYSVDTTFNCGLHLLDVFSENQASERLQIHS